MKLKALLLIMGLGLTASAFADNRHYVAAATETGPKTETDQKTEKTSRNAMMPGYCEIEISNETFDDVRVHGLVLPDRRPLIPFSIYSNEFPHYIALFYDGYCHPGMELYVDSFSGYPVFAGKVPVGSRIVLSSYMNNKIRALVTAPPSGNTP